MFNYKIMDLQTITIKEYLDRKGIQYRESGKELITKCLFSSCDEDSRSGEAHLYFNAETSQYHCKKCGATGNIITLAKHLGDDIEEVAINPQKPTKNVGKCRFGAELVDTCHFALPANIRQYLNARGITDAVIDNHKLGWGRFYGKLWITIPIKDIYGAFQFFKLRQDPNAGDDKMTYPKGTKDYPVEAQIYGWDTLESNAERIVICEGELDRLALLSKNIPAITSTHGAMTFKPEWVEKIGKGRKMYICFDVNDKTDTGKKGAERAAKMLVFAGYETYIITLPQEVGEGGDITDYLVKLNGNPDDLFGKYAKEYPEKIDTSQFKPLSSQELVEILGLTIKKDEEKKLLTFLCELSAYTESSQLNISFNAPSSTGKSYIPTEIAQLFPAEDVIELGYCSPTAFFHDRAEEYKKETNELVVDLSRKILIFLDQPHTLLLQHLRPLLSHDKKEIKLKITDKSQKGGLRTKNVFLRGFPAVIFCTAKVDIDEQETTRFILLSPQADREKIRAAIYEKIKKETDGGNYRVALDNEPDRKLLKERIKAIKLEQITDINICSPEKIEEAFFGKDRPLKPRHQRDIGRIISIIKLFALLNVWFREKKDSVVIANEDDIKDAFKIWDVISESQEHNLSPFVFQVFKEIIMPAWNDKNQNATRFGIQLGITRREISQKHFQIYGRALADWLLRMQIIPMLENAGLIAQEADENDKRKMLIYPTGQHAISQDQNNSELDGGVEIKRENNSEPSSGVTPNLEIS